ncbi:MAG: hypothetical protein ACI835_004336 [Planctomycetota bacterium]|jgi:hypothetical protein
MLTWFQYFLIRVLVALIANDIEVSTLHVEADQVVIKLLTIGDPCDREAAIVDQLEASAVVVAVAQRALARDERLERSVKAEGTLDVGFDLRVTLSARVGHRLIAFAMATLTVTPRIEIGMPVMNGGQRTRTARAEVVKDEQADRDGRDRAHPELRTQEPGDNHSEPSVIASERLDWLWVQSGATACAKLMRVI